MASKSDTAHLRETQVPEWEHIAARKNNEKSSDHAKVREPVRASLASRLDAILPPHKKYIGLSRKAFLWTLLAVGVVLLVLIIGLAAGLNGSSIENLPLPSNTERHVGDLTYYETGLGACGEVNGQSDEIVSISHYVFDAAGSSSSTGGNSNDNPLCGMMIRATRFDEELGAQRSVDLRVADRCTGCEPTDLDTTLGVFEKLAQQDLGRVDVTWAWLQPVATG